MPRTAKVILKDQPKISRIAVLVSGRKVWSAPYGKASRHFKMGDAANRGFADAWDSAEAFASGWRESAAGRA